MWILYLMFAVVLFCTGLVTLIGGGWALIMLDLVLQHGSTSQVKVHTDLQKMLKPAKGFSGKLLGLTALIIGLYFFYLTGTVL